MIRTRVLVFASVVALASSACSSTTNSGSGSGAAGSAGSGPDAAAGSGGAAGSSGAGGTTGAVSCSSPSTAYANNGGGCGTWRWGVKTGTDQDVGKVDLVPQVTTIKELISLPTPSVHYCTREPAELQTYELVDVSLKFQRMESDSDYHLIASDAAGRTMLAEVPYPKCVGHNSCTPGTPWLCEITHARAAVDARNPGAKSYAKLGTATVIGVGFFDTLEQSSSTPPTGMAPNGIELHPVLAICFGQGCDPLKGY